MSSPHQNPLPRLLAAALLLSAGTAAAETSFWARLTALGGVDSNAPRDYTTGLLGTDAVGSLLLDTSARYRGTLTQVAGDYSVGGRKFARYLSEDVLVQAAGLSGDVALGRQFALGVSGLGKDRRGGERDYTDLQAYAFLDFFPDEALDVRVRVGAHRFLYRPSFPYSFGASEENATVGYRLSRSHQLFAFGELGQRRYNGVARSAPNTPEGALWRRDNTLLAGAGYEYRGRFRFRLDYAFGEQSSNSFGESNLRHRLTALVGVRLPWRVNLLAQAAAQLTRFPDGVFLSPEIILVEDDENANVLSLKLARPVTDQLDVELRLAGYQNALPTNDLSYLRLVTWMGVSFRL